METTKPEQLAGKPVDNFTNLHKASVEIRYTYDGQIARPGYVWFVWRFTYVSKKLKKVRGKGKVVFQKCKRIGGHMIEKSLVDEHGEENVKRMVIHNIVNKQKRN